MDNGHRGIGIQKADQYKTVQDQMQQRPSMKDIMAIISERDAALLERNLALAEKKTALAERDYAVLQRDAAIVERENAIKERDDAIATLQLLENTRNSDECEASVRGGSEDREGGWGLLERIFLEAIDAGGKTSNYVAEFWVKFDGDRLFLKPKELLDDAPIEPDSKQGNNTD